MCHGVSSVNHIALLAVVRAAPLPQAQTPAEERLAEVRYWFYNEYVKARREDFIVIAQNAAELAERDDYLAVIDAIAQEQTWFDGAADGGEPEGDCPLPATDADIDTEAYVASLSAPCREQFGAYPDSTLHVSTEEYLHYLTMARGAGEIIFTVDYALRPENVTRVYQDSRALGFVPFVGNRMLDRYTPPVP